MEINLICLHFKGLLEHVFTEVVPGCQQHYAWCKERRMLWSVGGEWGRENDNVQDADWGSGGDFGQRPLGWVQVSAQVHQNTVCLYVQLFSRLCIVE